MGRLTVLAVVCPFNPRSLESLENIPTLLQVLNFNCGMFHLIHGSNIMSPTNQKLAYDSGKTKRLLGGSLPPKLK